MSSGGSSLARALHKEADQLSMFGADATPAEVDALRGPDGRLPANAYRLLRQQAAGRRGPGRPLGSVNKRSEQLAKLVIQQFGDPVLGAASLYAMPLDQLCEMLLVADGSTERAERMEELTTALAAQVAELGAAVKLASASADVNAIADAIDKLADAADSLESVSKAGGKAGVLALQALNVQLTARRFVSEYVHSKRPVAVEVEARIDQVLVMAAGDPGAPAAVQAAVGAALQSGAIEADEIARLKFVDGALLDPEAEDAEWQPVDDDPDDEPEGGAA